MGDSTICIDYALATASGVGDAGGLTDAELEAHAGAFTRAAEAVRRRVDAQELGFWTLPARPEELLSAIGSTAESLTQGATDVLVLGIGGSSLGARAIYQALCGPLELPGGPWRADRRLHLPDNSDPWLLDALLSRLAPENTVALVISKSGGTVETAAQLGIVQEWLARGVGPERLSRHLVAITDPAKGSLRKLAEAEGWATLPIPSNVGGRFSVLSAVGLFPAALAGVDVAAMLRGARHMADRCASTRWNENPAGVLALVHHLHERLKGRHVHVMMPYSDALRGFAGWYVQLWAESLGKRTDREGNPVEVGPTPLCAVGATDQHAQMQLFMEGPRDKLITFLRVRDRSSDLTVPPQSGPNAYLSGVKLSELLDAERIGTTQALALDGRPSLTLELDRLDAGALGELFFLYEAATAFSGELYDIDAFDQPGVELGKDLAYGLLGRDGYAERRHQVQQMLARATDRYRV